MEMINWTRIPYFFRKIYPLSKWNCWTGNNILFTFDDGPSCYTKELLDLSLEYRIKFAFFVLPEQVKKYPDIVRRIVNENHILGSHFSKHYNHAFNTKSNFLASLDDSIIKIEEISKSKIIYCRAPYGYLLPWQEKYIYDNGYKHVFWSLDSKDYKLELEQTIIKRILDNVQIKDIILFHDGPNTSPNIVNIIKECLDLLDIYKINNSIKIK